MLQFKNYLAKEKFLRSNVVSRLSEVYRLENQIDDFVESNDLIINDNSIVFNENTWEDYIQYAKIIGFDYAFILYNDESKEMNIKSVSGNILIKDNNLVEKSGIFMNCESYSEAKSIFLEWMKRTRYYLDIIYSFNYLD